MGLHDSQTRVSLLGRVTQSGETDQAAWSEFVAHYGPKVQQWCQRWGLQTADAEDVAQLVLMKLSVRMKDFGYNPSKSFRAWLKTVSYRAWLDFVESRQRTTMAVGGDGTWEQLQSAEARDDLAKRIEERFDQELLERAMQVVQQKVAPHNWEAFRLTAVEGMEIDEAAKQLGIAPGRVYSARSQIQQRLKQECRRLEQMMGRG